MISQDCLFIIGDNISSPYELTHSCEPPLTSQTTAIPGAIESEVQKSVAFLKFGKGRQLMFSCYLVPTPRARLAKA